MLCILVLTCASSTSSENDMLRDTMISSAAANAACSPNTGLPTGTSLLQAASLKRNVGKVEPIISSALPVEDQRNQQPQQNGQEEEAVSIALQGEDSHEQLDENSSEKELNVSAVLQGEGVQRQHAQNDQIDLLSEAVGPLSSDLSSNISHE